MSIRACSCFIRMHFADITVLCGLTIQLSHSPNSRLKLATRDSNSNLRTAAELEEAGADRCVIRATAAGLALGGEVLARLGASVSEVSRARSTIEEAMAIK